MSHKAGWSASEGFKFWHIESAVFERGPQEPAHCAVLAQLARHADSRGVAFPSIARICEKTRFSKRTVQRALTSLEREGWIRIEGRSARLETPRGFERKGNLYRLNLMRLGLELERRKPSDEGARPAGSARDARRDEGFDPAPACDDKGGRPVAKHYERIGWSRNAEETSSTRCHSRVDEVPSVHRRGVIGGAPLINKKDEQEIPEGEEPPYAPPCGCANVKNRERLPDQGGGSVSILAFPRQRSARMRPEWLDGEDAALWEEVTRVMRASGVCPESAGRKLRSAITGALRLESERSGAAIADVGNLAVNRWQEYQAAGSALFAPVGLTRFFAEGEWLRPGMWRYDRARLKEIRRGRW